MYISSTEAPRIVFTLVFNKSFVFTCLIWEVPGNNVRDGGEFLSTVGGFLIRGSSEGSSECLVGAFEALGEFLAEDTWLSDIGEGEVAFGDVSLEEVSIGGADKSGKWVAFT